MHAEVIRILAKFDAYDPIRKIGNRCRDCLCVKESILAQHIIYYKIKRLAALSSGKFLKSMSLCSRRILSYSPFHLGIKQWSTITHDLEHVRSLGFAMVHRNNCGPLI